MPGARIASALNKISQNSHFKKKSQSGGTESSKRRSIPSRKTDRLNDLPLIPGSLASTNPYLILPTYLQVALRSDDIQEFDARWDDNLLSMEQFPPDDILERLYKLRIRVSRKFKTVLELYDLEIHQKISEPDYQRLETVVKRSIDQKLRSRNFEARNERIEKRAVVKNRRDQRSVERGPGECWQRKAQGQCLKGNNCSFRND